jgi:hypothetical protein
MLLLADYGKNLQTSGLRSGFWVNIFSVMSLLVINRVLRFVKRMTYADTSPPKLHCRL